MFASFAPLRAITQTLAALALLVGVVLLPGGSGVTPTAAQNTLTISTPPFIIFGIGNPQGGIVNYLPRVVVSDQNAELQCTPGTGYFNRGSHKISCTATLGEASASAEFFLLVAYNDDTDVSLVSITSEPSSPLLPASFVEYRIEVRNNGNLSARQVVINASIPEPIQVLGTDRRCTVSPSREFSCIVFGLKGGNGEIVTFRGQLTPGYLGSFQTQMTVSLGDNQRDLEPSLNTRISTTVVEDPGFGENAVFIPLANR